ncbi:hypothetical protein IJ579_08400 [bacterium]|nr:hypothetical protein [bacterium]
MTYLGKIMAGRTQYSGTSRLRMGAGASRMNSMAEMYKTKMMLDYNLQMTQMQMDYWAQQPGYTVETKQNQTHDGFWGGCLDFFNSFVGGITGQQIGGYTQETTFINGGSA